MGALERYDAWEADLARAELDELYSPDVVERIDRSLGEPPRAPGGGWRGGLAGGALAVGLVRGLDVVFDDEEGEPTVAPDEAVPDRRLEAVEVHLAWGAPEASVAIVRRWLL